jgi:hypothetical protein
MENGVGDNALSFPVDVNVTWYDNESWGGVAKIPLHSNSYCSTF